MTTHDFLEDQKVRRFCLTLMQEARLWYATLNPQQQQLTWEGLQDRFRQQYSRFGSTREQYFHAWRSFQFDEATDTIDGYIHKVKQVATLLDYSEPQILELFKNTLPSRLYCMLYQVNDLRGVVEMAKRLLIKEQMDKKTGQSITSPFMQVNQNSSMKDKDKTEKRVSFSAVEAMERTTDSIERLASLMDRMDTKLDRREDQYRPRVYQGRNQGHVTEIIIIAPGIDCIAGISIKTTTEIGETIVTEEVIIGPITGITVGPETGTIIEEMIVIKGMPIGIKITVDLGIEMEGIEAALGRVPNPGAVLKTGMRIEGRVETTIEI